MTEEHLYDIEERFCVLRQNIQGNRIRMRTINKSIKRQIKFGEDICNA